MAVDIVSELLGRSNMNIKQTCYGEILQKKVSVETKNLHSKLLEDKTPLLQRGGEIYNATSS